MRLGRAQYYIYIYVRLEWSSVPARSEQSWLFAQENNGQKVLSRLFAQPLGFLHSYSFCQQPFAIAYASHSLSLARARTLFIPSLGNKGFFSLLTLRRLASGLRGKQKQSSSLTRRLCVSDAHVIDPCHNKMWSEFGRPEIWHTEIFKQKSSKFLQYSCFFF